MNHLITDDSYVLAYALISCVAAVILDQILDHSVWINADFLWGKSTEGLGEKACKFGF